MLGMNHQGKRKRFNDSSNTHRKLRDRLYLDGPDQVMKSPQATTPVDVIQPPPPLPTLGSTQPEYIDHVERVKALERYVADAEEALTSALEQVAQKEQHIANLEAQLNGGVQVAAAPPFSDAESSSPEDVQQAVGALEQYVSEAERLLSASRQTIQEKDRRIEALEVELETLRQAEEKHRHEQTSRLQQLEQQQHDQQQQLDQLRHQLTESQGHLAEAQQAAAHHQHALHEAVTASNAKDERLQTLEAELRQSRTQAETSHRQIEQVRHLQQRLENLLQSHDTGV